MKTAFGPEMALGHPSIQRTPVETIETLGHHQSFPFSEGALKLKSNKTNWLLKTLLKLDCGRLQTKNIPDMQVLA